MRTDKEITKIDLSNFCPQKLDIIPYELAQKLGAFVYGVDSENLYVIMQDSSDKKARQILEHKALHLHKHLIVYEEAQAYFSWVLKSLAFIENLYACKDISAMLDFIINQAISLNASDIHLESKNEFGSIRFRIDGVLREIGRIKPNDFQQLSSKIKLESKLDITENRLPQDGGYHKQIDGIEYDFRISCVPLFVGESIVIRILYKHKQIASLESLGLNESILSHITSCIHKSYGLILITGPTGSGKSTTLYATLEKLKSMQKKLITLEDPIEYQIPLATQVQINPEIGFSFYEALACVLRQDPDVIMIGEIRDKPTLDLALNASLSGHLVLASLHSNDCLSTLDRLFEMGAQRSVVATSLLCIVAQRLVGRLCDVCKKPDGKGGYIANGCKECDGIGIKGREVVGQSLFVDEELQRLLAQGNDIKSVLSSRSIASIRDDALQKKDKIDSRIIPNL